MVAMTKIEKYMNENRNTYKNVPEEQWKDLHKMIHQQFNNLHSRAKRSEEKTKKTWAKGRRSERMKDVTVACVPRLKGR